MVGRAVVRAPTAIQMRHRPQAHAPAIGEATRTARSVVAWADDYDTAEQAVDLLVARGFPVEHLCISGEGLRLVENVTGRVTYAVVALPGVVGGALLGVLLGAGFAFLGLVDPMVSALVVVAASGAVGAVAGAFVSSLGRWLEEGRRDFLSRTTLEAARYGVFCDGDHADEAKRLLDSMLSAATPLRPADIA